MTITNEGLQIPSLEEELESLSAEQRATIDALLANSSDSLLGNLNAIVASHSREAYEAIQVAFSAVNPDNAEGAILDGVCAITGTLREPAKPSRFTGTHALSVNLDAGASVQAGITKFAITGTNPPVLFVVLEDFENTTGVQATFPIEAEAEIAGPTIANAGTVTTIHTPAPGLNSVTNAKDAIVGASVESDGALRRRREAELRQVGACTLAALEADLLAYTAESGTHDILSVVILENFEDDYDVDTALPPHSFEAIIWDGPGAPVPDEDIAAIIAANRPPGIKMIGDITVADPFARFSRAAQETFQIEITLRRDGSAYAGDLAVKEALAVLAQSVQKPRGAETGSGVVAWSVYVDAAREIQGVNRITQIRLKFSGGSYVTATDIFPSLRAVAVTDTSQITVISSIGL